MVLLNWALLLWRFLWLCAFLFGMCFAVQLVWPAVTFIWGPENSSQCQTEKHPSTLTSDQENFVIVVQFSHLIFTQFLRQNRFWCMSKSINKYLCQWLWHLKWSWWIEVKPDAFRYNFLCVTLQMTNLK